MQEISVALKLFKINFSGGFGAFSDVWDGVFDNSSWLLMFTLLLICLTVIDLRFFFAENSILDVRLALNTSLFSTYRNQSSLLIRVFLYDT